MEPLSYTQLLWDLIASLDFQQKLEDPIIYHFLRDHVPNVRIMNASDCASMEPLSDTQLLWDLITSLDLERKWRHQSPFKLTLIGKKIPSWFHNQNYSFGREMDPSVSMSSAVSVIADMNRELMGIVICLGLQAKIVSATSFGEPWINWKYYTYGDHETWDERDAWGRRPIHEQYNSTYQVHILYISSDDLGVFEQEKIKVDFSIEMEQNQGVHKQNMPVNWGIKRCWWRVLCPEDIEARRQTRSDGYSSNIEFASQHLDGFNEVRITEDTHQNQCDHEITEEDGANFYAKHNQQDKGSSNECFEEKIVLIQCEGSSFEELSSDDLEDSSSEELSSDHSLVRAPESKEHSERVRRFRLDVSSIQDFGHVSTRSSSQSAPSYQELQNEVARLKTMIEEQEVGQQRREAERAALEAKREAEQAAHEAEQGPRVSLANILSWCPFLNCFLCNSQP